MRTTFIRIGSLLIALGVTLLTGLTPVQAADSASYRLDAEYPAAATNDRGTSTSYQMEGGVTWTEKILASTSYQMVTDIASTSSALGSSSSQAGGSGGGGGGPGGRRPRPTESTVTPPTSPTPSHPEVTETPTLPQYPAAPELPSFTLPHVEPIPASLREHIISFFGAVGVQCPVCGVTEAGLCPQVTTHRAAAQPHQVSPLWMLLFGLLGGALASLLLIRAATSSKQSNGRTRFWPPFLLPLLGFVDDEEPSKNKRRRKHRSHGRKSVRKSGGTLKLLTILVLLSIGVSLVPRVSAATTGPQTNIYNGHLLTSSGQPVTTAQSIRFSYWKSADYVTGDVDGVGDINTGAATYGSWQEVHTVTPNADGYFSVELGSVSALPNLQSYSPATLSGLYLQVEVKPQSSGNTAYELLDPKPSDATIDRSHVAAVPFTQNADLLDQRDTGTGSGTIAILGPGGMFAIARTGSGTNTGKFTLDADNTEPSAISLQFGQSLAKTLSYSIGNSRFEFNAPVYIAGSLTTTGLINGVDVTMLRSSTGALRASSGGGLNLNVSFGSYRLNGTQTNYAGGSVAIPANATNYVFFGSGGLTARTMPFPTDESYIPVAQVVTSTGSIRSITDRRALQSDDREQSIEKFYHAAFEHVSYQGDATNNVGQLVVSFDNTNNKNFYSWTSTRSALQDYDVIVRVSLPSQFVRWNATPLSVTYRSTSADTANNTLDISVYDTNGVPVTLIGSSTSLANTSWTTTTLSWGAGPTWTAGQDFLVRFKVSAKDNFQMHIGDMKLKYVELVNP